MTKTDYEKYIRTDELYALMRPKSDLVAHDELLFQIEHQTAELWMKVIVHNCEAAVEHLKKDEVLRATDLFARSAEIEILLARQLDILERMPPKQYVHIRRTLGKGSGQQSPGFNELLGLGDMIWPEVKSFLERGGHTIIGILDEPEKNYSVHLFLRSLFELDEHFRTWRFVHFRMVERQIGVFVDSLKGVPAEQLKHGLREHMMPDLWAAVNEFTRMVNSRESSGAS